MVKSLPAVDLISLWEKCSRLHPIDQALTLLAAAFPKRSYSELAQLSIGQRDALLLELRALIIGPSLDGRSRCPACGEQVEFHCDSADLLNARQTDSMSVQVSIQSTDVNVRARLPNSTDLAAIVSCHDAKAARAKLVERCIEEANQGGDAVHAADLPEEALAELAHKMSEADPLADIELTMNCPACNIAWQENLDIISFLWTELTDRVHRLLGEVHVLATAYGWRESDILALSPERRRQYLQMVIA